jgi:hypothetical protein
MTLVSFAKRWLCSPNFSGTLADMTRDWLRLAQAVADRRRELGLSQDAVRRAGGPSDVVIANIENNKGAHPRDDTINKLDRPLRWQPGSAQQILAGGDPDVIERTLDLREISNDVLLTEIQRRFEEASGARGRPAVDIPVPVAEDERKQFPLGRYGANPGESAGEDRENHR